MSHTYTCQEHDLVATFPDGRTWLYAQTSAGGSRRNESARACNRELEEIQKKNPTAGYALYEASKGQEVHDPRRQPKQTQRAVEQRSARVAHNHEVGGSTPPGATKSEGAA